MVPLKGVGQPATKLKAVNKYFGNGYCVTYSTGSTVTVHGVFEQMANRNKW